MDATDAGEQWDTSWTDYIQRVVGAAPPLTAQQREKLAGLLQPLPEARAAAPSGGRRGSIG